ncbi:hypothetical protein VTN77DRAFT_4251 [Rasamsonia byssochlamydoides]|uniref:uncharacterized protein n=1 Tax=Rasamsonia byssochlamydoides TaxID=89139 RepID=UPI003743F5C3
MLAGWQLLTRGYTVGLGPAKLAKGCNLRLSSDQLGRLSVTEALELWAGLSANVGGVCSPSPQSLGMVNKGAWVKDYRQRQLTQAIVRQQPPAHRLGLGGVSGGLPGWHRQLPGSLQHVHQGRPMRSRSRLGTGGHRPRPPAAKKNLSSLPLLLLPALCHPPNLARYTAPSIPTGSETTRLIPPS